MIRSKTPSKRLIQAGLPLKKLKAKSIRIIETPIHRGISNFIFSLLIAIGKNRAVTPRMPNTLNILEPIMAQRRYIKIPANESGRINFVTGISENKEEAFMNVKKYSSENVISRAFRMAFARNQVELSYLNVTSYEVSLYDDLMKYLI